jgi:hypothetical protein
MRVSSVPNWTHDGEPCHRIAGSTRGNKEHRDGDGAATTAADLADRTELERPRSVADGGLSVLGIKINVSSEVKPFIDHAVNDQINTLQAQLRNDPTIEQVARREWIKMCRSISFAAAGPSAPNLWLEMKPTRAFAANPRIDANSVTLTVGVQAETRIVGSATKPNCPFPAQLQIVPPLDQGRVAIAAPIDIPFTEVNRLMEAQLKGKNLTMRTRPPRLPFCVPASRLRAIAC